MPSANKLLKARGHRKRQKGRGHPAHVATSTIALFTKTRVAPMRPLALDSGMLRNISRGEISRNTYQGTNAR
jgi:hypothetical protein